jgi:hypothetical protein
MKNFIVLISLLLVSIADTSFGQSGVCTIPCCDQCFPYIFCNTDGTQYLQCSKNPNEDGTPTKSYIPNCVEVDDMRTDDIYQPQTSVPSAPLPPNRETIFHDWVYGGYGNNVPWELPYDTFPDSWDYVYSEYELTMDQWSLDSTNFLGGLPQGLIDTTGFDYNTMTDVLGQWGDDQNNLFTYYYEADSIYLVDSASHAMGTDVPYTQIWSEPRSPEVAECL